jgi:hypothetical protein
MAPSPSTLALLLAAAALTAAAAAEPPLDALLVEQLIWESRAFVEAQDRYGALHGLFDRMSTGVEHRLMTVQREFDTQAAHLLSWEDRAAEKLARAELAMATLVARVRATTVGGGAGGGLALVGAWVWAFVALAVVLAGLGVQYYLLRGAVKQAQRAGPLLGGFGSGGGGGGGGAKHHWV